MSVSQPVCDATGDFPPAPPADGGGETGGSPLQPVCDQLTQAQQLCDATEGFPPGGGLPEPPALPGVPAVDSLL